MKDEIMEGIDRVIRNGRVILGPEVEKLEKRLAEYVGVRFGIGVSSGTDALVLSLRALGIGEGDFVITTPYTFFATASCISRNGAVPIFLDIDERTYNLDLDQVDIFLERLKDERSALGEDETVEKILKHYPNLKYDDVKALIPVHLFGRTMDLDRLLDVKKKKNLKIVEDSAQSIGSEWRMRDGRVIRSGSVGDVSILSFFPTKNLGAYGDGGMVLTNDEKIAKRIRKLRVHGSERKYFHDEIGFNARLDEIQALVLNIKM
ncbi:MAG TPA: DegT/DnrJ/EryC1/StrS family aminotransferase, partial [Thermotogales bacterium]|nr:DegT/DnrJ/EryC1/StrS family aminotransferase [Thermotogales bacterium]